MRLRDVGNSVAAARQTLQRSQKFPPANTLSCVSKWWLESVRADRKWNHSRWSPGTEFYGDIPRLNYGHVVWTNIQGQEIFFPVNQKRANLVIHVLTLFLHSSIYSHFPSGKLSLLEVKEKKQPQQQGKFFYLFSWYMKQNLIIYESISEIWHDRNIYLRGMSRK